MANQFDFGEFVARLMRDAEANFPLLAPIRIDRDQRRDVWRVMTRRGEFAVSDQVPQNRRQLVEFFVYNLSELQRRAEYEDRHEHERDRERMRMQLPGDVLQPRIGGRIALHVGDRINVNGVETRIVAIRPNEITVEQLDGYDQRAGRCDCRDCRDARYRRQLEDHAIDGARYAAAMWGAPPIAPPRITREAEARSIELLRRNLTREQLEQWDRSRMIEVRGQSGARYRIRGEIGAYNIDRIGGGRLCCTPGNPGELPLGDYVLGQKLALELDEERFLNEANFMGLEPVMAMDLAREPGAPILTTTADLDRLFRETYMAAIPPL